MYIRILKIILIIALSSNKVSGQQQLILKFNSEEQIDSIKIENLQNKSSRVISENSFEIVINYPTEVESNSIYDKSEVYPNPFQYKTIFSINSDFPEKMQIAAFDISGRMVARLDQKVENGLNQFSFAPDAPGMYFLVAGHNSIRHLIKLICIEANSDQAVIEYIGGISSNTVSLNLLKSVQTAASSDFTAEIGDMLKFTAYSNGRLDTKYDFLFTSSQYEFSFPDRYFTFRKHLLQERIPGFVDMVFSIFDTTNQGIDYLTSDDFMLTDDNMEKSTNESYINLGKSSEIPTFFRTVLLLDNSSKIASNLTNLKTSVNKFVQSLVENQELAIYVYSDSAVEMCKFTNRKIILEYWISKIKSTPDSSKLFKSLEKPLKAWQDKYTPYNATQGSLIVLSTGIDSCKEASIEDALSNRGDKKVYAVTLDAHSDSASLKKLASTGQYYPIREISELDEVFESIQTDIVRSSNSYYCLNYMSDKREGEHSISLSIAGNSNSNPSAYFSGSYNADGFASVTSGVFLNPTDSLHYGFDTIRCFCDRINFAFTYDSRGEKPYAFDTLTLQPVTYGGGKTAVYTWELPNSDALKIEFLPTKGHVLVPLKMARDTVKIILRDISNDYSKDIIFIMDPPEFYENMGIVLGEIKDSRLDEISGIAASTKYTGFFWIHNDSGDDANLFLINSNGNVVARVFVESITSRDWEDIAVGPGPVEGESYIYIADIGDLDRKYNYKYIYRIAEPDIDTSILNQNLRVRRSEASCFTFNYADGPRDAEILMIDPCTKDLFMVTKRETNVQIYTMPYPQSETDTLILKKSDVTLPFRMTNGGDISNDGNEILIKNLTNVYYWKRFPGETIIQTLARNAMSLPYIIEPQGEAIGWLRDGSGYLTVSEKKDGINPLIYLYRR